jgi:S1-C subfamily serine protease
VEQRRHRQLRPRVGDRRPLPTGRRRAIDEVIRTSAPMHDGFAGGAFLDTSGQLLGVATAAAIRGLGVVIPAAIAWKTAATVIEHGRLKRGYLGIAGQPVALPANQRGGSAIAKKRCSSSASQRESGRCGWLMVGDVLLDFDGHPITSPEDCWISWSAIASAVKWRCARCAAARCRI